MPASQRALDLLAAAVRAADATGAEDPVALDVSLPMPFSDVFLIVTGNSERNVVAIADAIEDALGGRRPEIPVSSPTNALRREGRDAGRWVLLDFNDLVVHVFHREDRLYYGLERLWLDCPAIPLREYLHEAASSFDFTAPPGLV